MPRPIRLLEIESDFVHKEILVMSGKGILELVEPSEGQVVSNISLRPKKDGSYRFILDLTWVNLHIEYEHFKMGWGGGTFQLTPIRFGRIPRGQ